MAIVNVQVVAELGINHGGDLDIALQMVDAAADAGADAVKVQSYQCKDFLPPGHPDWDMFARCELHADDLAVLGERARARGVGYGVTPTSHRGVQEAVAAGATYLKNGSDFLLRHDLIRAMLATGLPTWVSCGMGTPDEIHAVPKGARKMLCTSLYPCPDEEAHLSRLVNPLWRGYSDHTLGNVAAVIATYFLASHFRGDTMLEKHFTLNTRAEGPDHWFSADPVEFAELVRDVKRASRMIGSTRVGPSPGEAANRERWRVTTEALRAA